MRRTTWCCGKNRNRRPRSGAREESDRCARARAKRADDPDDAARRSGQVRPHRARRRRQRATHRGGEGRERGRARHRRGERRDLRVRRRRPRGKAAKPHLGQCARGVLPDRHGRRAARRRQAHRHRHGRRPDRDARHRLARATRHRGGGDPAPRRREADGRGRYVPQPGDGRDRLDRLDRRRHGRLSVRDHRGDDDDRPRLRDRAERASRQRDDRPLAAPGCKERPQRSQRVPAHAR